PTKPPPPPRSPPGPPPPPPAATCIHSASNRLVDEALRMHEHPLIAFKDGPAGRRARLVGGPDVWEVIGAVRSVREAEPALAGDEVLAVVAETSGTPEPFI